MCVILFVFSALSSGVGTLQISIIVRILLEMSDWMENWWKNSATRKTFEYFQLSPKVVWLIGRKTPSYLPQVVCNFES